MTPLAVTRFTAVSALGHGLAPTLAALQAERTGLQPSTLSWFDRATFIGEVAGLDEVTLPPGLDEYDCRNHRLAELALRCDGIREAVAAAARRYGRHRIAVILGTTTSGIRESEIAFANLGASGALPPDFRYAQTHDLASLSEYVRRTLDLSGASLVVSTACSSSAKTFCDAHQLIETGVCDAAVVGGVDSLCLVSLRGFASLELLSREPCRPSDAKRSGISIGEAAGFALLQRPEANATDLLFKGYGESCDSYHMSSPHPDGRGAELAMCAALRSSGHSPQEIDYINLHGTGSVINDEMEALAVTRVFGASVPCSSTKGWTGHTLGAAGIVEAIISLLAVRHGFLPKTLGMINKDPRITCNVLSHSQVRPVRAVLSSSFGFGGNNCSLVFGMPA